MSKQQVLLEGVLRRFDDLIAYGTRICSAAHFVNTGPRVVTWDGQSSPLTNSGIWYCNVEDVAQWSTNCVTLLQQVLKPSSANVSVLELFRQQNTKKVAVSRCLGILKGLRSDFADGFLNLYSRIESEITCDYLTQTEVLLEGGGGDKYDHIPAAVLLGAILENHLRSLCSRTDPPISVSKESGERKTLNPLIDDLKATGVYNELKAKQLRAWADIRNKAAHGNFEEFSRSDVSSMLQGVTSFLQDYGV